MVEFAISAEAQTVIQESQYSEEIEMHVFCLQYHTSYDTKFVSNKHNEGASAVKTNHHLPYEGFRYFVCVYLHQ